MFCSPPKTGKTFIALDMCLSIASGLPFLEEFPVAQGPVIIYSPEGPRQELQRRMINICERREIDFYRQEIINIDTPVSLEDDIDQQDISRAIHEVKPNFVLFDPLSHCFGGDENGANEIKSVSRWLTVLAQMTDAGIMVCHHSTKAKKKAELLDSIRGSGALSGFGDHYLFLENNPDKSRSLLSIQKHFKEAPELVLSMNDDSGFRIESEGVTQMQAPVDRALQVLAFLDHQGEKQTITVIRSTLGGDTHKYAGIISQLEKDRYLTRLKVGGVRITKTGKEYLKRSGVVWDASIGATHTTPQGKAGEK